jgi:hypothetical protein
LLAKDTENTDNSNKGETILHRSPDGKAALDTRLVRETVWINQRQMTELLDKDTDASGLHIRNIYKEGRVDTEGN